MANSKVEYTGDGSTTNFSVPFSYIQQEHVLVKINGVTEPYVWLTPSSIQISPAPVLGAYVKIYRETSPTTRLVDYNVPSTLTEEDLDTDSLQAFYLAQEAWDRATESMGLDSATGHWDGDSRRIVDVDNPVNAQDVVTKAYGDANYGGTAAAAAAASAAAASASASAAATSASNASTSETNAAASYDAFDDRYLGAKASDPTLDNDGDALLTGALYWNTADSKLKIYSGSAWTNVNELTGDITLTDDNITGIKVASFTAEYDNGNSGASKTISFSNGMKQKVTLTAATTLTISMSGCATGHYQLKLIQDGTGSWSVTWSGITSTNWLNSAAAPTINGNAAGVTIVNFFYDGTTVYGLVSKVGMA